MNLKLNVRHRLALAYHLIPFLVFIVNPFGLATSSQRIVFSALLMTVIWWGTGFVNRNLACAFLLAVFLLFGQTTPYGVFKFAFSPIFHLIVLSFLLAQGISNSQIAEKIASLVLERYGSTPIKIVLLSFAFNTALIFIIPQPATRVILLAAVYSAFLEQVTEDRATKEVLLFSIFISSTATSMLFINGDIMLNYVALELGAVEVMAADWIKAMFIPTICTSIFMLGAFLLIFKAHLGGRHFTGVARANNDKSEEKAEQSSKFWAGFIMAVVVLLWLTESWHHIDAALIALVGVLAMLASGVLSLRDLKAVNVGLLLFLITVFSIGTVLGASGISTIVFTRLSAYMPRGNIYAYLFSMAVIVMALHMFVGSCIATLSVVVPSLVMMSAGLVNPLVVTLLSYLVLNIHYLCPFHHVTIMVGSANNIFSDKLVMRFGLVQTFVTLTCLFGLYIPWWKIIGLI